MYPKHVTLIFGFLLCKYLLQSRIDGWAYRDVTLTNLVFTTTGKELSLPPAYLASWY